MKLFPSFFFICSLDSTQKKKKEKKKSKKHHKYHDVTYNKENCSGELINEGVNSNKTVSDVEINMDSNIYENENYHTNM